jgi:hypothetical protein
MTKSSPARPGNSNSGYASHGKRPEFGTVASKNGQLGEGSPDKKYSNRTNQSGSGFAQVTSVNGNK